MHVFSDLCFPLRFLLCKLFLLFIMLQSLWLSFLQVQIKTQALCIGNFLPPAPLPPTAFSQDLPIWLFILKFNLKCQLFESPSLTTLFDITSPASHHITLFHFIHSIYESLSLYFPLFDYCLSPNTRMKAP